MQDTGDGVPQPSEKDRLAEIHKRLLAHEYVSPVKVRELLSWFGAKRRGSWKASVIRRSLTSSGLTTDPPFEYAYINATILFRPLTGEESKSGEATGSTTAPRPAADLSAEEAYADPTFRVSRLAAANKAPTCVVPDATLAEAVTIMLANNYSQLPVMVGSRALKGAVSWRSIGRRLALDIRGTRVSDFMESAAEVRGEDSLFEAIRKISAHEFVLVRAPDERIVGIITATDLGEQLHSMAEPFLLLSEIENHVRHMVERKFLVSDLIKAKDPEDAERVISSVSELTLGELVRLLESPEHWGKLGVPLDRSMFVGRLDRVRTIRNDVMHFDPDGIDEDDMCVLRDFAALVRDLHGLGVT